MSLIVGKQDEKSNCTHSRGLVILALGVIGFLVFPRVVQLTKEPEISRANDWDKDATQFLKNSEDYKCE
jgi:hypothetical protein